MSNTQLKPLETLRAYAMQGILFSLDHFSLPICHLRERRQNEYCPISNFLGSIIFHQNKTGKNLNTPWRFFFPFYTFFQKNSRSIAI